jgi:cell shape-determining protein MreC
LRKENEETINGKQSTNQEIVSLKAKNAEFEKKLNKTKSLEEQLKKTEDELNKQKITLTDTKK